MRCILLKPVLKYTYHTIDHLNHFCQHTTQWHELAGSPASGTYCLMSWGGAAVRWTESKHHEECNQSAHLETISHPSPWKNYLPWENYRAWYWSLVPKRSGTTGTKDTYSVVPPPPSIPRKFSSSQIESLNLQNSDSAFSPSNSPVCDGLNVLWLFWSIPLYKCWSGLSSNLRFEKLYTPLSSWGN